MYLSSLMASDMILSFMVTLTGSEGMMCEREWKADIMMGWQKNTSF
jgi:hypothetical protein